MMNYEPALLVLFSTVKGENFSPDPQVVYMWISQSHGAAKFLKWNFNPFLSGSEIRIQE